MAVEVTEHAVAHGKLKLMPSTTYCVASRWHEAVDQVKLPTAEPLVQEIDWAFGTLARWKRARLLDSLQDTGGETCSAYGAVARLWGRGDPEYASRADSARRRLQELGCITAR